MDDASRKNNNSSSDFDESIKNEYNLLGFESKYKTELYKEEDFYPEMKNNEINIEPKQSNKKLSLDSTSISYSQELNKFLIFMINKENCLLLYAIIILDLISIYQKDSNQLLIYKIHQIILKKKNFFLQKIR